MIFNRLLVFTAFFLTAILPVSAQEKSSLYIDTLNEIDKILGDHHFFKNTTFCRMNYKRANIIILKFIKLIYF